MGVFFRSAERVLDFESSWSRGHPSHDICLYPVFGYLVGRQHIHARTVSRTYAIQPIRQIVPTPSRQVQNWTRRNADPLGNVLLYVEYTAPVEEVPAELRRIANSTDLWKGEVYVLQVTDASEHEIQIRALVDARDSGEPWDLRCYVREKLIQFLQEKYPNALPGGRAELHGLPTETISHRPLAAGREAK
jgi:hypothetical protein